MNGTSLTGDPLRDEHRAVQFLASHTEHLSIPRPHVPHGPSGLTADEADAMYLRKAADSLESHYKPFGSNLRATIVKLVKDAADAIAPGPEDPARAITVERTLAKGQTVPGVAYEHDEDGQPIPGTLSAGWDVSFGCRVNFGPNPGGELRVSVHVSDAAQRDGVAVTPTTSQDLRALARHLLAVARDADTTMKERA